MTLLENACCLVAFRVGIRGIHCPLRKNPFLRLKFGCMSFCVVPFECHSMYPVFSEKDECKDFSGNTFFLTIPT